jgi:uncharacterized protein (TIGR03435 family)
METALLFIVVTPASISSSQETTAGRLSFEVATIKPSGAAGYIPGGPVGKGGYFAWRATTLRMLVWTAYFVREWQMDWKIEGGTFGWVDSELWDVEARARQEDVDTMPKDPIAQSHMRMLMLQSLLEDRFKLRVERQTRQAPVYNLVIAKGGPKLKPDDGRDLSPRWQLKPGNMVAMGQSIEGRAIPIERLTSYLLNRAGRPVIDRTDLKGLYNISLKWTDDNSAAGDSPLARKSLSLGPAFFTALEEQLGLRLESAKGPVEYLVIKSAQKPDGIKQTNFSVFGEVRIANR